MKNNLEILRDELAAGHPGGPGGANPAPAIYSADPATALAQLRAKNQEMDLPTLTGDGIFEATDFDEYELLAPRKQDQWLSLCARPNVDLEQTANRKLIRHVFGAGQSNTIDNLAALRRKLVSRAEVLKLRRVREGTILGARSYDQINADRAARQRNP